MSNRQLRFLKPVSLSMSPIKKLWLTGLLALVAFTVPVSKSSAQTIVGTGDSSSFLVIQAAAFDANPFVFEYRYTYDPLNLLNSYDLLVAVMATQPQFTLSFINYGDEESPNYFLNTVSYLASGSEVPVTLINTGYPDFSPYWVQWVSGGESGYPEAEPIAGGAWTFGSGLSSPYRYLQPGSWDGYIYNDGNVAPSIAPVPEPSSILLIIAAGGILYGVIWKRRAQVRL